MARKHVLLGELLSLSALFVAVPALAEYLGPDRHVVQVIQERNPSSDYWTCSNRVPPPGVSGTCILQNPSNPCPDAGGHHPSREQQSAWCLWGTNYADWGGCGCTAAYTTRTVETDLPEATIAGDIQNCAAVGGWCSGAATLHLVGSEPLAGESILALEGARNGEPFACAGGSCDVPLVEGSNAFTYWALSSFGDSSRTGAAEAAMDTLPPILSADAAGTPGHNGWWVSSVALTAAASDPAPGSGLATLEIEVDSAGWFPFVAPQSIGDGTHDVRVRAIDRVGHTAEVAHVLRIDTTPPGCSLDGPGIGWLSGIVRVTGTVADDGSGPVRVEVSTDGGGAWLSVDALAAGAWGVAWDTRSGSDGVYTLLAQCWDQAGNGSISGFLDASVDNSAPRIVVSERWTLGQVAALAVEDRGSGLAGVRIGVDGGTLGASTQTFDHSTGFPSAVMWDGAFGSTEAPPGEYVVTVEAWDAVGNRSVAGAVVIVLQPQPARTQAPPPTSRLPSAAAVPSLTAARPSPSAPSPLAPFHQGRSALPTPGAVRVVPLAPVQGAGLERTEAPARAPDGNGPLWGAAGLAVAAVVAAYALTRKEERRKELEAQLRQAAEAAARADTIRQRADASREPAAPAHAGTAATGSKPVAQVRPGAAPHEPDAGESAHNAAIERRMVRIDEQLAAQEEALREEGREAIVEARREQVAEASRRRRAASIGVQVSPGTPRPATVTASEWRGLSAEERGGIVEQAERDRLAGLRAAAIAIGADLARTLSPAKRNAERADEEAQRWQASLAGPFDFRRGELTADDQAAAVAWAERERQRWRDIVYALSAAPAADFRRANADLGVADQAEAMRQWTCWQASVRGLADLPPLRVDRILNGQLEAPLDVDDMPALRALLLQPLYTAHRPTLSTWRLAGEMTGQGLEQLAMAVFNITPWERDMVGGVGLAETRSVGPAAMLMFDMTYYNRVVDREQEYWSGYDAATRGFANMGSAYDLVAADGSRVYEGRDYARYLQDSLAGDTRQNRTLLYSSSRWWDPRVRWAFTHRAAAVAAQDLGWRVIAGYRIADLLGEDVAFFLNDGQSAWWTYQTALMDAGVVHYETAEEQMERYAGNVRSAVLEQVPDASRSPEALDLEVRNRLGGIEMLAHPDPNTLNGLADIVRTVYQYENQYAANPNAVDLTEFSRLRLADGRTELVVPRYEARLYNHADGCIQAAEQGLDEAPATPDEYTAHRMSYVGLLNTVGNYPNNAVVTFYWPSSDPGGFVEYATPFAGQ